MNSAVEVSRRNKWVGLFLKRSLLVFVVVLFFCDIAIYLSLAVSPRLQPQYWIALLVAFGCVLAWFSPRTRWQVFRTPVFLWCVLFLALTLIFYAAVPTSHIEQLKERVRDVVLLTAFLGVFLMLPAELVFIRKVVFLAVIFGALANLASLVHISFSKPLSIMDLYRPDGFYPNPNESAIALILGMMLSLGVVWRRWREAYAVLVLAAVSVTFSREALLGWVALVAGLCMFGIIRWKIVIAYAAAVAACVALLGLVFLQTRLLNGNVAFFYQYQAKRFLSALWNIGQDGSIRDRLEVLKLGWSAFMAHPFVGNGIGFTYHWSMPISTHNMYLLYMDDYGVIGFFLYPLLIWCMARKAAGETRGLAWTMAIFLLFWGFFDHNIVQNYYSLFAIALTAAMSKLSADEARQRAVPVPAEAGAG